MKILLHSVLFLGSMAVFSMVNGTEKPSTWQKFKNVFSSKKPDAIKESEDAKRGPNFFQSIKKLYEKLGNFYGYSQESMLVFGLKVKGLKAMQEEGRKNNQKAQLEMPLKRLRADLFMSLIEYLKQTKEVAQGIKIFIRERNYSNAQLFDSILQTFDIVIKEGDHVVEQLLQTSKAYALKNDEKKIETEISNYFGKVVKLFSSMKKATDETQKIVNKAMPVLKGINVLTLGSTTTFILLVKKLNNVLKTFQLATDLGRDITTLIDNEMAKKISALQNESVELSKDFEVSKVNIKKIEIALEKNQNEVLSVNKPMDNFSAEAYAEKSLENTQDQSDDLVFEDLKPKNK